MAISHEVFVRHYLEALEGGTAAIFAGAGLSQSSGYVDWKTLLADVVADLRLHPETENLVAAAQYHVNERGGRGYLNQLLISEFTKNAAPNRNHQLLARLPIEVIWTTNYDTLIEDALKAEYKLVDVKHRHAQLGVSKPGRHVTVYKMHGDISAPDEAVLVKEDYERYEDKRRLFSYQLQGDLVSKTFLFVGFSFTDPNVDYVLGRIRGLMGQDTRPHYCLLKRVDKPHGKGENDEADYQYSRRRQELFVGDLKRYGIQAVMLDSYDEVTVLLEKLNQLVYRKNVLVSGSANDFGPLGKDRLERLCRALGRAIVERGRNLTSGLGLGIGGVVVLGAIEGVYRIVNGRVDDRLTLRPFPQDDPVGISRKEMWTRYREEMIGQTGSVIFISGNKSVDGSVVPADGCLEEFEIAKRLRRAPIPIGCTGHAASQIWEEVMGQVGHFYPNNTEKAKASLETLNDADAPDVALIDAVFTLADLR